MLDSQQVAILAQEIACAIRDGIREGFADSRAARARCEQNPVAPAGHRIAAEPSHEDSGPAGAAAFPLRFRNESLRQKILSDPDDEPSAGNCPQGDDDDDYASKDASSKRDEVRRPSNPDQPDVCRSGEKLGLPGRRVGRGQHVQQVHAERGTANDHPESGAAGQVRGGPEVLRGLHASSVATPPASDEVAGDLKKAMEWLRYAFKDWKECMCLSAPMLARLHRNRDAILSHIAALEKRNEELKATIGSQALARSSLFNELTELQRKLKNYEPTSTYNGQSIEQIAAERDSLRAELDKARPWLEWLKEWHEVARMALQFSSYPLNSKDAYAAMPKEPPK